MTLLSTLSFDRQRVYAALARRDLQRDPHHTQARRLRQALDRANDLALPLLRSRLAPIDITPVWPPLGDICHDMALSLCSDQAQLHIAQNSLLQSVLPAKSMAPAMVAAMRDASKLYAIGWRNLQAAASDAVRPGSAGRTYPRQHASMTAADFAHGHVITVIAMLRLLAEGLARPAMARQSILSTIVQNPRLGNQVAAWLARHQSALLRHAALRVQSAALDVLPAPGTASPVRQPRAAAGPADKVARDMDILRFYAAQGNREAYWNYLAANGDRYARLALGVVRNDTVSGVIANGYAQMRADQMKVLMSERDWHEFGVALMQADLAARESYLSDSIAMGKVVSLPVKDIATYHAEVFNSVRLDPGAWTAHIPLLPYLQANDQAGAERVWEAMLDERFFASAASVMQSEAQALFSSGNATLHAGWLGKIGVLLSAYAIDPWQAYADADKIGSWCYDNGGWSRMRLDFPASMDGSYSVERAPARLAAQLQADRLFRLARQVPLARHPLDTTAILPGR